MENIGCVIVTYNPSLEALHDNLLLVKEQVKAIVVVDNGSTNGEKIENMVVETGLIFVSLGENMGIAAAQNRGLSELSKREFEWALTLDQDSKIPEKLVHEYEKSGKMSELSTGIITAGYFDRNWTSKQIKSLTYQGSKPVTKVDFVISSGNLVRISAWRAVKGFDEFLFIDMVDYDFDAKLLLKGYQIWQVNTVSLDHAVGKVIHRPVLEHLLLLPETGLLADHPAFRQYYIYRNTIIFNKRYPMFIHKKFIVLRSFIATRRMLVYSNSLRKLASSWHGIVDGARYKASQDTNFRSFSSDLNKSRVKGD